MRSFVSAAWVAEEYAPTYAPTAASGRDAFYAAGTGAWRELASTVQVNAAVALVLIAAFEYHRPRSSAAAPGRRPLAWVAAQWRLADDDLADKIGLDAFMLIRYLRMCRRLFFLAAVLALGLVLPLYATGPEDLAGFYRLTIRNLSSESARFWVPAAFQALFTAVTLVSLEAETAVFAQRRRHALSRGGEDGEGTERRCSVLLERIPPRLRSDPALKAYFEKLLGCDCVASAVVYLDLRALEKNEALRQRALEALERASLRAAADGRATDGEVGAGNAARPAAGAALAGPDCLGPPLAVVERRIWRWADACGAATREAPVLWWRHVDEYRFARARVDDLNAAVLHGQNDALVVCRNSLADFCFDGDAQRDVDGAGASPLRDDGAVASPLRDADGPPPDDAGKPPPAGMARATRARQSRLAAAAVRHEGFYEVNLAGRALEAGLETLDGLSHAFQVDLATEDMQMSSTGVVTFVSPAHAAAAAQLQLTSHRHGLQAAPAPDAEDIIFKNVGCAASAIRHREWVFDGVLLWVAALWLPLVTLLQALSNLDEMAKVFPFLRRYCRRHAYERALVSGYLPVLLLLCLMALVPVVLGWAAVKYVGAKSRARVQQKYVLKRNFYFTLLSIFVTVIGGSLTRTLHAFVDDPRTLFNLLGKALPGISAYFMQLLVVKTLFSLPWELAQPLALGRESALRRWRDAQGRLVCGERRRAPEARLAPTELWRRAQAPEFKYGSVVPQLLLAMLLGMLYSAIAPLITVTTALFFVAAEAVYTRNFLHFYKRSDQGGILLWPSLVFFTALSLCIGTVTLMSYLTLRGALLPALALAPCAVVPWTTYYHLLAQYVEPTRALDRETAVAHELFDAPPRAPDAGAYRQPVLNVRVAGEARPGAQA